MNKFISIALGVCAFVQANDALGQRKKEPSKKDIAVDTIIRPRRPLRYITFEFGRGRMLYRDFATSPLFYNAGFWAGSLSYEAITDRWFTNIRLLGGGTNSGIRNESPVYTDASFFRVGGAFQKIRRLTNPDAPLFVGVGGSVNASFLYRLNEGLGNNRLGYELFANVAVSALVGYDYEIKSKNWFVRTFVPKKGTFSFLIDAPLVYANYRTANYIYTADLTVRNQENFLYYNKVKLYDGFQIGTMLAYKIPINNRNAFRLSYHWNLYNTANGPPGGFQYADHLIFLSFMFNLK